MQKSYSDKQRRIQIVLITFLGGCLLASLMVNVALSMRRQEQVTVLLPTQTGGDYRISNQHIDERYVADAAASLTSWMFNVSPEITDWRRERVLAWVHPDFRREMAAQMDEESANIKKQVLSSAIMIQSTTATVGEEQAEAVLRGVLTRWISSRRFSQKMITVKVVFRRDSRGTILLSDFTWEEVDENQ